MSSSLPLKFTKPKMVSVQPFTSLPAPHPRHSPFRISVESMRPLSYTSTWPGLQFHVLSAQQQGVKSLLGSRGYELLPPVAFLASRVVRVLLGS